MTRLDQLPEQRFIEDLTDLARKQEEIKTYQRAGSDTVLMRRIFSNDDSDLNLTSIGFDDKTFNLVFTPDETEFDTSLVYKMEYEAAQSGGTAEILVQRQKLAADNVQRWLFVLIGSDSFPVTSIDFKFYFWASGPGTFSTELL